MDSGALEHSFRSRLSIDYIRVRRMVSKGLKHSIRFPVINGPPIFEVLDNQHHHVCQKERLPSPVFDTIPSYILRAPFPRILADQAGQYGHSLQHQIKGR